MVRVKHGNSNAIAEPVLAGQYLVRFRRCSMQQCGAAHLFGHMLCQALASPWSRYKSVWPCSKCGNLLSRCCSFDFELICAQSGAVPPPSRFCCEADELSSHDETCTISRHSTASVTRWPANAFLGGHRCTCMGRMRHDCHGAARAGDKPPSDSCSLRCRRHHHTSPNLRLTTAAQHSCNLAHLA